MSESFIAVRLDVHCETDQDAARACETLTRSLIGLALDGMSAKITAFRVEMDDDEPEGGE